MKRVSRHLLVLAIAAVLMPAVTWAQQHEHGGAPPERLGKVHFPTTCAKDVQAEFDRAVALLHSFWFAASGAAFESVAQKDPSCAMAHWGVAMANWGNPLGGTRTPQTFQIGLAAVAKARAANPRTPRERGYIDAVELLYKDADKLDHPTRVTAYEKAMEAVVASNPKDSEAAIFYAIALDAAAPATDKTYAKQLKAAAILEKAFAAEPGHPGISHYLIHSYDVPTLAGKGLSAARRYAGIAPDAPHALHMPSHIFTRVGAWEDSISSNKASAASAEKAGSPPEALHAMDYQVYAYLQLARDADAQRVKTESEATIKRVSAASGYGLAGFFAAAAIPARVALERGDWSSAAALTPLAGTFPATEAITWFARAIGAARSGNTAEATTSAEKLAPLRDRLVSAKDSYWADIVDIQSKLALGWAKYAQGQREEGLTLVREAAKQEDATDKSPISPGPLAPARELLAEMLADAGRAKEALVEFEAVMVKEPGRYRSLAGGMAAAEQSGDKIKARKYAMQLIALAKSAAPGRPELTKARTLVR
jgi:hypothetical protein